MSRAPSGAVAVAAAAAILLSGVLVTAGPALGADTKRGAINEFIAAYEAADVDRATAAVCAARRDAAAQALDVATQMGLEGAAPLLDELTVRIRDVAIEIVSDDGPTALAAVTGRLVMRFPEERIDELVTAILQADLGPGEEVSPDDVDFARPLMRSMLNGDLPIEEEVPLVLEDGAWLVCGGFGLDAPGVPDPGMEASISVSGLCALATPEDLTALGGLAYDASNGFDTFCSYSTSDYDAFHSLSLSLNLDDDAATTAGYFAAAQSLQVAGAPAYASGPDAFGDVLFVQVGPDSLQITLTPPDPAPEGFDWLAQAIGVAELFVPLLPGFRDELAGPATEPTPQPSPGPSLCDLLPLDAVNAATGLGFDHADGDASYCGYIQVDGSPGWHSLTMSLTELPLDEFRAWMLDAEDATVAGRPALRDGAQLVVGLPGDAWVLQLSGWIDEADAGATLSLGALLDTIAATVVPLVDVPEPTGADGPGLDALHETVDVDDPGGDAGATLPGPLCDYVDLDAINALGPLTFDEVSSLYLDLCSVTQTDLALGWSTLMISANGGELADLRAFFPGAADVEVEGYAGVLADSDLFVGSPAGTLALSVVLPDWAIADGMDPGDILLPVAGLVIAALEDEGGR